MNQQSLSRSRVTARTVESPSLAWGMLLVTVAFLLMQALTPLAASAGKVQGRGSKPTIVLGHGAWADPSGWQYVVSELRQDGYRTVTPRLDLLSIEGDAAIVRAALDATPGDKIVVAHSY